MNLPNVNASANTKCKWLCCLSCCNDNSPDADKITQTAVNALNQHPYQSNEEKAKQISPKDIVVDRVHIEIHRKSKSR